MFEPNGEYVLRKINDSYFLMSAGKCINKKWLYKINETGAKIWENCGVCNCIQEIVICLEKIYNRKFSKIEEQETKAYIELLITERLIKV